MKPVLLFLGILVSHTLIAQKVGIGTPAPQSTLDVKGNLRVGGVSTYMRYDSLSGKVEWVNSNLFVPVTQALIKHSAAADGLFYNNSGGVTGQLEYRNILGNPVFYTNFINGRGYFKGPLGIATTSPLAGLHVADSSVLFSALGDIPFSAAPAPQSGAGRRMMWYPDKAAFRVGYASNNEWDQVNIGNYSFAAGYTTRASGIYSAAIGAGAVASGTVAIAMGNGSVASGEYAIAIGNNAIANGFLSTAFGINTLASGQKSTAIGDGTVASGLNSTALGFLTQATGIKSTAMGDSSYAIGDYSTAMGFYNTASGYSAMALGSYTVASGYYSTAFGNNTMASGYLATTMGAGSTATGFASTAMGHYTIAKAFGSLSIGVLNDAADIPDEFTPEPTDRMFQIGNGTDEFTRSNAFTVLRNGNTGIRLSNPPFPLSFAPDLGDKISLWSNSSNSYGFGIQGGLLQIHTDVSYADIAFGYGSSNAFTETMRITGVGTVGIGTTTPNQMLDVNGNIQCWTVMETSDKRFKRDITPIPNALQKISQLNGYNYYWKNTELDKTLQSGVIAQEVQQIFPELVKEDADGMLSVNYSGLIPVLIESTKELKLQVEELQKQNEEILLALRQIQEKK